MTINTLQVGQNVAASNITVERTTTPQSDEQRVDVNADAPLRTDNEQINVSADVQESATNADTNGNSSSDSLKQAVEDVESFIQTQNRNLAFSIDDDTNRSIVTVRDSDSGDVIRQIPSEEVLQLAERIQNLQDDIGSSVGVFVNRQV